ncbi:MAG: IS110 family transposase [Candidatus Desulfofervidus auxilii]|nr:IS110 family transposase [Candidatus Desulfofervidus auxilii]
MGRRQTYRYNASCLLFLDRDSCHRGKDGTKVVPDIGLELFSLGDIIAFLIRYEIDDIERFSSAKKLYSYTGIVPSTYSSGGKTYHGRITKQGNK